jgi:hypothetical protein
MVKPKIKEIKNNIRRLHTLIRQLSTLGPFMRGSVVRLGPRQVPIFSLNKNKRTQLVYLGESRLAQATAYSQNYRRLTEISEEITLIVMELLRASVPPEDIWPPRRIPKPASEPSSKKPL